MGRESSRQSIDPREVSPPPPPPFNLLSTSSLSVTSPDPCLDSFSSSLSSGAPMEEDELLDNESSFSDPPLQTPIPGPPTPFWFRNRHEAVAAEVEPTNTSITKVSSVRSASTKTDLAFPAASSSPFELPNWACSHQLQRRPRGRQKRCVCWRR